MAKKKLAFDNICYNLPSDILFLILTRVPIKSLLRFKFVCKAWNVMISDYEYRRTHRDQSKMLGREKLLLYKDYTNEFEFRDLETSQLVTIAKGVFPSEKIRKAIVLCWCDGLLLFWNPMAYKVYVLWNPSTEEYQTLACPYFNDKRKFPNGCGLCYDSSADDYKVIFIYNRNYSIYSLKNNCWTEKAISLRGVVTLVQELFLSQGISIGGCVFWPHYVVRNSIIVYFDGKSDELKELPMPDFVGENTCFRLTSLKSFLCLYGGNRESVRLDIWIMERDGWKLLLNICNLQKFYR
ncbi:F-box/kelch-repeat protein At3g23880-like [Capsicum annuum]|uniref:F-box/kelch-repeat protein At3g23880-like n=1 Tax=Capsicum annuum TaxID=4072 RepID=UPI001FB0ABBE|nr:F-box/kelch-repeat protein At3g23880-like [Capsicum annuum]